MDEESKYQVDIKPLEKDAIPDKGYEAIECVGCNLQINKKGPQDSRIRMLENLARSFFISDITKEHRLILHYRKK